MFDRMIDCNKKKNVVQQYDETNRRAERKSSRRKRKTRRRGRRRRTCSVLQAALSVLLCPALSLPYSQALIRRTRSTVQNISRQCKQDYTLRQLMIVKIPLTICKHKKAVGNEKRAKTSTTDKSIHESKTLGSASNSINSLTDTRAGRCAGV